MAKHARKRPQSDTTVPHVPADVQDIMAALLKTPPPPAGNKSTRRQRPKRRKAGSKRKIR